MTIQDAETTETININTRNSCLTQIFCVAAIAQYLSYYACWISVIQKKSSNNYFKVDKERESVLYQYFLANEAIVPDKSY